MSAMVLVAPSPKSTPTALGLMSEWLEENAPKVTGSGAWPLLGVAESIACSAASWACRSLKLWAKASAGEAKRRRPRPARVSFLSMINGWDIYNTSIMTHGYRNRSPAWGYTSEY